MIEFIKTWVINIVVMIFFIAFIELLIPKSNMRRYINMILGLLIIVVLINPIIKLMTKDINIDREVFLNIKSYNTYELDKNSEYIQSQNKQITEIYKKKLEEEITELIIAENNYNIVKVKVSIEENIENKNFGEITSIQVNLGLKRNKDEKEINIKIDEIDRITVNSIDHSLPDNNASSPEFDGIIDMISSLYRVPKEKVIIISKTLS